MALFDDVKAALRVSHDATDSEVKDLIASALFDMADKGVSVTWLGTNPLDPSFAYEDIDEAALPVMAVRAIKTYAKANYGYDNDEAERFLQSYDSIVCSLLNSRFNAAYEEVDNDALGLGNNAP